MFFTAVLRVDEKCSLSNAAIADNMVQPRRKKEAGEKKGTSRTAGGGGGGEGGGAEVVGYAVR